MSYHQEHNCTRAGELGYIGDVLQKNHLVLSTLLAMLPSCAHTTAIQRTIAVSQCVVSDARLGKVIIAPEEAQAYLRGVAKEAQAILQARKANPNADFIRERKLITDILDLVERLQACVAEGGTIDAAAMTTLEGKLHAAVTANHNTPPGSR